LLSEELSISYIFYFKPFMTQGNDTDPITAYVIGSRIQLSVLKYTFPLIPYIRKQGVLYRKQCLQYLPIMTAICAFRAGFSALARELTF